MPINLSKGQKVDLTKGNPGLDGMLIHLILVRILTWMYQHFYVVLMANVLQTRILSSMAILCIQVKL